MLVELPDDVLLCVFVLVDLTDIGLLRLSCKRFWQLTKQKSLWQRFLDVRLVQEGIPVPGLRQIELESATADQLEQLAINALKLRRNWTAPFPQPKMTVQFSAPSQSRVIRLHFLRSQSAKPFLLSVSLEPGPRRRFWMQLWDASVGSPIPIAQEELMQVNSLAVNESPDTIGAVAVHASSSITVYTISPAPGSAGSLRFEETVKIPLATARIHLFSGTKVLSSDAEEGLYLWDTEKPQIAVQLRNLEAREQQTVLGAALESDCLVVFRSLTVELYLLPRAGLEQSTVMDPVMQHRWPWRLDSISVTKTPRPTSSPTQNQQPSISFLIRFGSFFPWPVNLLHQFILPRNEFFQPDDIPGGTTPFVFPPVLQHTIGAPVRLFCPTDLTLGPYGSAVWIDTHTEDFFGHADRGQRLGSTFTPPFTVNEETGEQELSDQVPTTRASSVFQYHEADTWVKLDIDEEEGRVAVGGSDGTISVMHFG